MRVDGACLCGAVTYEARINPERCAICHCTDCQTHAGTAFGVVVHIEGGAFRLMSGALKVYEKVANSGRVRALSFCPDCGTRIHARTPDDPSAFFGLRLGTIRQRDQLTPRVQVWCSSALPWVFDLKSIPQEDNQ